MRPKDIPAEQPAELTYNIRHWGGGFFGLNPEGQLTLESKQKPIALSDIAQQAIHQQGLRYPILLRFNHILKARIEQLSGAFNQAIAALDYQAGYTPVYPIKVNQQRRVVEELIGCHSETQPVGLEAGSKPELLAVLAVAPIGSIIVCNGYKDEAFIELALLGEQLGHEVIIVIEKLDELNRVAKLARKMHVQPRLGLRVRLRHSSQGKWQNSGGLKSKFGLSNAQLIKAIDYCRDHGLEQSLQMLHFHLGSQVADLTDIKNGVQEAARYYTEIRALGFPIKYMDVGGGLGIDYEGSRSRSYFSMNYSLTDYGWHIVEALKTICDEANQPHPHIISESGRALTAHHAVLISNIIDIETKSIPQAPALAHCQQPAYLRLFDLNQQLKNQDFNRLTEVVHETERAYDELNQLFLKGDLRLDEVSVIESVFKENLQLAHSQINLAYKRHRELSDYLNELLAEKIFLNFSLFQSTPDAWGINQVFPVIPLNKLNDEISRRAIIQDITCDSDGRIKDYVDGEGVEPTLPIPETLAKDDLIGIFLVGAYQEILGDMHNLFGDTDSVDVVVNEQGQYQFESAIKGDTTRSVLEYVNFEPEQLIQNLTLKITKQLKAELQNDAKNRIAELLEEYTYLQAGDFSR